MTAWSDRQYSGQHKATEEESDPGTLEKGSGERNLDSGLQVQLEKDDGSSRGCIWKIIPAGMLPFPLPSLPSFLFPPLTLLSLPSPPLPLLFPPLFPFPPLPYLSFSSLSLPSPPIP